MIAMPDLTPEVERLKLINGASGNFIGSFLGRLVVMINSWDPDIQTIARFASGIFAGLASIFGLIVLPFSLSNSLTLLSLGVVGGVFMMAGWKAPYINPDALEKKPANADNFKAALKSAGLLEERFFQSKCTLPEVKLDFDKASHPSSAAQESEVIAALTQPKMFVKDPESIVVRYNECPLYTLPGGYHVIGEKKEKYIIFSLKNIEDSKKFFIQDYQFFPQQFDTFMKGKPCLVPNTNKLIQIPAH